MATIVERAYGWQVRWRHVAVEGNAWQGVAFRRDRGQTRGHALKLCEFVETCRGRIADTDPAITSGQYRQGGVTGSVVVVRSSRSLEFAAVEFDKTKERTPRTRKQTQLLLDRYFKDWLGLPVRDVTSEMLNERWGLLIGLKGQGGYGLMESSARAAMTALTSVLRFAYRQEWTKVNPAAREKLSFRPNNQSADSDVEPLLDAEYYQLLSMAEKFKPSSKMEIRRDFLTVSQVLRIALEIMGETGLRLGEVLALAAEDIDLLQDIIHVDNHIVDRERVPGTKGGGIRKVPLTPGLKRRLVPIVVRRKPRDPLLPATRGGFMADDGWRAIWDPFRDEVVAAEVLRSKVVLKPHLLRHSYATWQAPYVPAIVLMQLLGHKNLSTTQRYYKRGFEAITVGRNARLARHEVHGEADFLADQNVG